MSRRTVYLYSAAAVIVGVAVALLIGGIALYRYLSVRTVGEFFMRDGVAIHYTDEGQGTPVVLLHGFAVNADLNWRRPRITQRLARDYRVIAVDLRGHGLSGKPHDRAAYGPEMARDIVALLDHLELPRAHVVGYSLGGFVTLYLAAHHADRLHSAILGGAGWERFDPAHMGGLIERFSARLERGEGVPPPSGELNPDGPKPSLLHTAAVFTLTRWFNDGVALARVLQAAPQLEVSPEDLTAIAIPLGVIVGDNDPLARGVDALAAQQPHAQIVRIAGDHLSALRTPEFTAALEAMLADFAGHPAPTAPHSTASPR